MRRLPRRVTAAFFGFVYRNYNLLIVLGAFGTMITLAAISGYWIFYRTAYVLGALVPICFLWARISAAGLDVTVERPNDRLQVGQQAEARVRLRSRSALTKLWLEVEDCTDIPGAASRTVLTLPAKGSRNWRVSLRCARRGVFSAGPVRVATGDPFGLFRIRKEYGDRQPLIVLPRPEQLPYFWAPAAQLPGEGVVHRRTHYVTPNAAAVREYYPGDSYNRIHWRSTARLARLMVKTFEMDPTSNIWIVLDLHGEAQAGTGDESTEEYGVRVATSLAYRFLQTNRMLGFLAHGAEAVALDPARGSQQYNRVLEALAVSRAGGERSLSTVLQEEGRRFGRHTTVIIVTPSTDREWVLALQPLLHQGARVAAVLLDPESFAAREGERLPVGELLACNVLTYVVTGGSDLSLMLGPAGVVGEAAPERQNVGLPVGQAGGR